MQLFRYNQIHPVWDNIEAIKNLQHKITCWLSLHRCSALPMHKFFFHFFTGKLGVVLQVRALYRTLLSIEQIKSHLTSHQYRKEEVFNERMMF